MCVCGEGGRTALAHMSAYVRGWKLGQERLVLAQQCPQVTALLGGYSDLP